METLALNPEYPTPFAKAGFKTYTHKEGFASAGHTDCVSYIDQAYKAKKEISLDFIM